jgi:6-phosphogluconolactonase
VLTPHINISPTIETFEIAAAQAVVAIISAANRERGGCLIALSGGNTPRGVYRRLGDLLVAQSVDLSRLHLIFSDERMVAPDDPNSNYRMVEHELLSHIPIPPLHVHRIKGEVRAEVAAREYERELQKLFPLFARRCDLILLGVGVDGHTASLFPESNTLRERDKSVRALFVPRLATWRVTLTLPVINRARAVLFLVTGKMKASVVAKILRSTESRQDVPATLVRPHPGSLTWMLDAEAASQYLSARASDPNDTASGHVHANGSALKTSNTRNGTRSETDENN